MWTPVPLASPRDVTEKSDHCMKPSAPQRSVSLDRRGEGGNSLKLLHQTREGHTTNLLWKLATERSPGHPGAGERKRTRVPLKQEIGSSPHWMGISAHLHMLPAHVRLQHPLSPNPGQLSRSKLWHKAFSRAEGGQECNQTGTDPARVKLGTCSSAQERYLLLPTSFSAATELRNPSVR